MPTRSSPAGTRSRSKSHGVGTGGDGMQRSRSLRPGPASSGASPPGSGPLAAQVGLDVRSGVVSVGLRQPLEEVALVQRVLRVPTVSMTYVASMEPSSAHRCIGSSAARPVRKPARKASPTPVGSALRTSRAALTWIGSSPRTRTVAPSLPWVLTCTRTCEASSSSLQPVFWQAIPASYSLVKRYSAPSISPRMPSPSTNASCCDGSAAKGIPRDRHSSEWRCMASGSFAPMTTRSSPPTRSATGASSMSRASDMAPA